MKKLYLGFILGLFLIIPCIKSAQTSYTLSDIIDGASRVKKYILNNKKLPKIVGVGANSDDVDTPIFTYLMGVAIKNIYENKKTEKISVIKATAPSTPYKCEIIVYKADYIDAITRVINYIKTNGAAPAYVLSSETKIGYIEYTFGFAKILDFYINNQNQLPNYNRFYSSEIYGEDEQGEGSKTACVSGITFKAGINEKNNGKSYSKYLKTGGTCAADDSIRKIANKLASGKSTTCAKAKAIMNYAAQQIKYEYYYNSKYYAIGTLRRGAGNCCDHANLIVSMCRVLNIPARYSHGQQCLFNSGHRYGHIWAQILVDDIWYVADATSQYNSLGVIKNWNTKYFSSLQQYDYLPF